MVPEGELASVKELSFAFRRAASRLREMVSQEYWNAGGEGRTGERGP
jgi:predicted ATPase